MPRSPYSLPRMPRTTRRRTPAYPYAPRRRSTRPWWVSPLQALFNLITALVRVWGKSKK